MAALLLLTWTSSATFADEPSKLSAISVETLAKEVLVKLAGTKAPDFTGFTEKNPDRVVVDLSGSVVDLPTRRVEYPQGMIRSVVATEIEEDSETVVRVTIELRKPTTFRFEMSGNSVIVRLVRVEVPVEPVKKDEKKEKAATKSESARVAVSEPSEGPLTERTDVPPPPIARVAPKLDEGPEPPVVAVAPPPPPPSPPPSPVATVSLPPKPKDEVVVPPEPEDRKTIAKWSPPAEKRDFDPGNHTLTYIGFRQKAAESEVFVRLDSKAEYKIQRAGQRVLIELPKTRVNVRNNERELDTSFFPSHVTRVQAVPSGAGTRIEIDLRDEVEPRVDRIGTTIAISFPNP